jgi:glycosyl transferase family 25
MNTYVINLARAADRREHMIDQLETARLEYEVVPAIDGQDLYGSDFAKLIDPEAVAQYPRWLTPGALACALSHRRAYERFLADGGDCALIVEDDTVIPSDAQDLLDQLRPRVAGREVILLYYRSFALCRFSSRGAVDIGDRYSVAYPIEIGQPNGAQAYVISRSACERLVELMIPIRAAADSWAFLYEQDGIESLRCVIPRPFGVRDAFKSTIDYVRSDTAAGRISEFVARRRLFPLYQLLALKRAALGRRMSHFAVVDEPIAWSRAVNRG